jgi:WD40 repeat protein
MSSTSGTIKKTYLRYECADAFSLTCDVLSSCSSSQIISCLEQPYPPNSSGNSFTTSTTTAAAAAPPIVFTVCKSNCAGFHLRRAGDGVPYLKIGHRDPSTVGTGRALNSDESTCIQVFGSSAVDSNNNTLLRIATGWMEGSIRIFTVNKEDVLKKGSGVVHSLLQPTDSNDDDEFVMRDPLVFKGHYGSPVTCLSLDRSTGARLASGGSDGSVVVWDLIAETGLFRLRGHKRPITHLSFIPLSSSFDGLISSSMDGLVKIWDLDGQCCTQTITNHRSEVWSADTIAIFDDEDDNNNIDDVDTVIPNNKNHRWRLITGSSDIQLRVWDLRPPTRTATTMITSPASSAEVAVQEKEGQLLLDEQEQQQQPKIDDKNHISEDSVAVYMGSIHRQTNERVSLVKFHPSGKLFGVLAHGSKQVEIYSVRSIQDSQKRRKRRLRRRREKKESATTMDDTTNKNNKKKRGILDDDDDVGDTNKNDSQYDNNNNDENNEGNDDAAVQQTTLVSLNNLPID